MTRGRRQSTRWTHELCGVVVGAAEISTKIKDRAEEELAAYVGKESAVCCSENEKRILTKVSRPGRSRPDA